MQPDQDRLRELEKDLITTLVNEYGFDRHNPVFMKMLSDIRLHYEALIAREVRLGRIDELKTSHRQFMDIAAVYRYEDDVNFDDLSGKTTSWMFSRIAKLSKETP